MSWDQRWSEYNTNVLEYEYDYFTIYSIEYEYDYFTIYSSTSMITFECNHDYFHDYFHD